MTKPVRLQAQRLRSTNRSFDFIDFVAMAEAFGFVNIILFHALPD